MCNESVKTAIFKKKMLNQKSDNFTYKYNPITSEKKVVSDDKETFTSKILRFWENFKWTISSASRRKNNLPAENPKLKNPILFGWTRKFLKERIFGQTRRRHTGTETLTSGVNPKNSYAKSEKPGLSTPALRFELCEYSDQLESAAPVSMTSRLNGRFFDKAEKISTRLDNEFNPGGRLSVPGILDCHELNTNDGSTPFPALSHSNSSCCCSALSSGDCRTSGHQTTTPRKCTHWDVYPAKHFQSSRDSLGSRLSPTDSGKASLDTEDSPEALERLLHRDCPFKTSWHQYANASCKKSRKRRLDSGTSHRCTRGQRSFCHRSRCNFLFRKKRNVHCACQLDCLGFNNHSTFCWKSRSYSPACSRVTYDGNSNTTYCINTPLDDKQSPLLNDCLGRHCFCYACLSKWEHLWQGHRNLKCSPLNNETPIRESVSRRDMGTSTADLIETGHTQVSKELSVDKTCSTGEPLSKRDLRFEPALSSSQATFQQKSFPRAKTGNHSSRALKSSDLYKGCSRSLDSANSSRKPVVDERTRQFAFSRDEKRNKRLTPFKYGSTGGFTSFSNLHSNSCPLPGLQLEDLTLDANEIVQPLLGYSMLSEGLMSKSRKVHSYDAHPISKNAAHDPVPDTNSIVTKRPLDRGHEKPTLEDENGVISNNCRASRRLKADAILDGRGDISKLKSEECHGGSNQKAACGSVLDFRDAILNKRMARCRSLKSSKPELGALETLAGYFASTPKREGSQEKDKCPQCSSQNLLNAAEETTTSTDATEFPDLAAWDKSKTPILAGVSATTALSDCPRFQYPPNLARYTSSDFFSQPGFEKPLNLRDPASRTSRNTNSSLKEKIMTDNNSLEAEPQDRIPWFTMNLTSCSKSSSTRYCQSSLNADESESRILDGLKEASASNDLKFRKSSLSTKFSIRGDFKSDEHETSYFPNSDTDDFDTESYKYGYIPLHHLETLPFPVI